jgi:hypothetical protein
MIFQGKVIADDDFDLGGHHLKDWRYLGDIPSGGAALGQALLWTGTAWAPGAVVGGDHTHTLTAITQSGATMGQVATWDGAAWTPATPTAGSGGAVSEIHAGVGISASTSIGVVTVTCDLTWSELANKPTVFAPASHTQALTTITQSSATTGQVATWSGAVWAPATPTAGSGGVTHIDAGTGIHLHTSVGVVTITCDLTWSELANKPTVVTHIDDGAGINVTASTGVVTISLNTNLSRFNVNYVIDGVGAVLSSGVKGFVRLPAVCTLVRASMFADAAGNVTVELDTADYTGHTASYTDLTGGTNLALSAASKVARTSLGSWTTSFDYGDLIRYSISGTPTVMTKLTVVLDFTRS